ncbi:MAG: hypothetical protein M3Q17_03515 [Actinomycetota bacterium]|nr:hypothetical protein [Actinomycetota bacterium]
MRRSVVVGTVVAAAVAGVGGVLVWRNGDAILPGTAYCEAQIGDAAVRLDLEQAHNAALIAAVAVRRELPARATSIALAAAYQESKIANIDYGDRDSLGLFQQRPSQGWGTREQILDPYYATGAFYDALVRVDGYESMPIHDAAQEVQRSADGGAYEQHESAARTVASALTGYSPAALSCRVDEPKDSGQRPLGNGLTENAGAVLDDVERAFGALPAGGFAAGGVRSGHAPGSAHYEGRAVDFFFRPVNDVNSRRGWALAQYLVANADRLAVRTVIFDDRIWTAARSGDGWREYAEPDSAGDPVILRHLDHVHVDVA